MYHSMYDSFEWMAKFGDPTWQTHKAVAQIWGWVALSLADEPVLPFDYTEYADALASFVAAVQAVLPAGSLTLTLTLTLIAGCPPCGVQNA